LHAIVAREATLADLRRALGVSPLEATLAAAGAGAARAELTRGGGNNNTAGAAPSLAALVAGPGLAPAAVVGGLLGALREATLAVVGAVEDWRVHERREEEVAAFRAAKASRGRPRATAAGKHGVGTPSKAGAIASSALDRPFLYQRENYLLRLVSDCDFLAESPLARAALGWAPSGGVPGSNGHVGAGCGVDPRGNPLLNPAGGLARRAAAEREMRQPLPAEQNNAEGRASKAAALDAARLNDAAAVARPGGHLAPVPDPMRVKAAEAVLLAEAKRYAPALLLSVATAQQAAAISRRLESPAEAAEGTLATATEANAEDDAGYQATGDAHPDDIRNVDTNCLPLLAPASPQAAKVARGARPWTVPAAKKGPAAAADAAARRAASLATECGERAQGLAEAEAELAALVRAEAGHRADSATHCLALQELVRQGIGRGDRRARSVAARKQAADHRGDATGVAVRAARAALCLEALELNRVRRLRREKAKLAHDLASALVSSAPAPPAGAATSAEEASPSQGLSATTAAATAQKHTQLLSSNRGVSMPQRKVFPCRSVSVKHTCNKHRDRDCVRIWT
jgi:hypothetical protein